MIHLNKTYLVGEVTVTKIEEVRLNGAAPSFMYPAWEPEELEPNLPWLTPSNMDGATGNLIQSTHSWLVRTPHHTILVDTGTGNDKDRPQFPVCHQLKTPYLQRLVGGRWVPTFPNARHVFSKAEEDYYGSEASHNEVNVPSRSVFEDSVLPIIESGQAERISNDGGDYLDHFTFHPTKGHSIGHMSIELRSKGHSALFTGDVMHHPLQVRRPDWNSVFCEWQEEARASRRWVLEQAAERRLLLLTPHFAETSAGYVAHQGERFAWHYE
jgi:glyoxylase-like metal-dependent hydrolase (beta-lactamase superfamily II)